MTFLLCMPQLPVLVLQRDKEKPIRNFHHWIFDGAVKKLDDEAPDGGMAQVQSQDGDILGTAYINRKSSIVGRMIAFGETPWEKALEDSIDRAIAMRKTFFNPTITNAYRLINSEGDGIPGLVVDQYADVLVVQSTTLGIDRLMSKIVELLRQKINPHSIVEKSKSHSRAQEGLSDCVGVLSGEAIKGVTILENGLKYFVDIEHGHKTGFYLDQRDMRRLVGSLAKGKSVLNCFSYTGAFSIAAAKKGALRVDSVDISKEAIELAKKNFELNAVGDTNLPFGPELTVEGPMEPSESTNGRIRKYNFFVADVFEFLRRPVHSYDFIILDPPAFAKRKSEVKSAARGYQDINRLALTQLKTPGLLLTSSCSYHIDEKLFQQIIFAAARESGKRVRIIQRHHQAFDHPINVFHPEGSYLKSLLLWVE